MSPSRRRRTTALVPAATALALVMAGCAGDGGEPTGEPSPGGDLVMISNNDTGCLDPWQVQLRGMLQWLRPTVDSLLYEDQDGQFHGWLATGYEVNDDATEFTFTLRDDVEFSDGSFLTAETVKANLDAMKAMPEASVAAPYLVAYEETIVVDEQTATVVFDEPNAQFLYAISTPNFGIYSTDSASLSVSERCQNEMASSGAYAFESYTQNEQAVLAKSADYAWGPENLDNTGAGYLDTITVNIVTDPSVASGAALGGEADLIVTFNAEDIPALEEQGWVNGDEPEPALSASWIIKMGNGIAGTDEAVRHALTVGIDREALQGAMMSTMSPSTGILNTAHPFYVDQSDRLAYDPDAAVEYLEEAGWEPGDDGIREKDGQRLTVDTIFYTEGAQEVMELAQVQLAEIGVELSLSPVTSNDEAARRADGSFEMRFSWFTGPEPTVISNVFNETEPPEAVTELIAEQAAYTDFDERKAVVSDLMDAILDDALLIPVYQQNATPWWSADVTGMVRDVAGLAMLTQVQLAD